MTIAERRKRAPFPEVSPAPGPAGGSADSADPDRAACPTRQRLDDFRAQSRGQASSVIVTVFGDAVLPRGGQIWLGSLITLLEPLGLNERLVRTSVFRLAQDDWLEPEVQGRRSNYRLTATGRRRFDAASQQIYAAASAPWDQRWCLVMLVGELSTGERERLRRALFWHGFGELGSHSFVHPGARLNNVFEALESEGLGAMLPRLLPLMAANPRLPVSGNDADMVRGAWNLGQLAQDYTAFVAAYRGIVAQWQDRPGAPAAFGDDCAFQLRTLLIHDYRRLLLRDPELPGVLLPADWPGHEARALCKQLYQQLLAASERHLDRHLQLASGETPTATALMAERFGLSDPLQAGP
jgi:phenylacetic acid degradation operon negative regulatory protein